MMAALCVISVAACVYFVCGRAFQGYAGGLAHSIIVVRKPWDWLGAEPWFLRGLPMNALDQNAPPVLLFTWFGILAAGLAGLIPLGSGADRWRLGALCASTALLAGLTFPLFARNSSMTLPLKSSMSATAPPFLVVLACSSADHMGGVTVVTGRVGACPLI